MKFRGEIGADTILDDYDPPEVSVATGGICVYLNCVCYYVCTVLLKYVFMYVCMYVLYLYVCASVCLECLCTRCMCFYMYRCT